MTQIAGFEVDLLLKNNLKVQGVVANVVDKILSLDNAEFNDGSKLAHYSIAGSEIKDLKVIDIPRDLRKKKNKQRKLATSYSNSTSSTPVPSNTLQDDAILFYRDSDDIQEKSPVISHQKKKVGKSNVYSNENDITWDDNIEKIKQGDDFDFGASTARFDKNTALEEFSSNDHIEPSKRLAGHNKLKPQTKTKYENDENVIERKADNWDHNEQQQKSVSSSNNNDNTNKSESRFRSVNVPSKNLSSIARDQSVQRYRSPSLEVRGFQITSESGAVLPLASPIQLLEVERLSNENFKISPQLLAENASRSLASLVIKMLGGSSRISETNHNLPPLVLILVGNNRAGARSLATGRQLTNQGLRVISISTLNAKNNDELDNAVKEQLELYKLAGGKYITSINELNALLTNVETPIELVVDALQGYDTNLSDLWGEELQAAQDIIRWTNNQDIGVVSLDIPSGVDAGSGLIGGLERIDAKWVVSLGLPVSGVLHAYSNGVALKGEWTHHLVDIGIPQKLFKKGTFRKFDRKWFSGKWGIPLIVEEQ